MEGEMKYYNLTNPQKSIWMIEQFYPGSNINCVGGSIKVFDKVNFNLLIDAFNLLLQKNDGLRLRIIEKDGKPLQYIADYVPEKIRITDISKADFDKKMENYIPSPFSVIDSKLYSFELFRFEDGEGAYIAYLHHLICDAWTTSLFVNELMTLYSALKNNEDTNIITYPSYTNFIESEEKYIASNRFIADKEYWESMFDSSYSFLSLKAEAPFSGTQFKRKTFKIPSEILWQIKEFAENNNSSVPTFLLSIYSLYFSKLLETERLTIGNPVLNRSSFAEKSTFGTFISTVPVVINYNDGDSFVQRTQELAKNQKNMYRHLKYPYGKIAKYVKEITGSSEKLYDIVFSYQNARSNVNTLDIPFEITWLPSNHQLESIMIHVTDTNDSGTISINYDYQTDIFTENEILMMHDRIERIMYQVLGNPQIQCKDIELVSLKEKNILLRDFNTTEHVYNKNTTIISEFQKGVIEHPNITAITFNDRHYTYEELNNLANQLGVELLRNGIQPGDIVGILLPRSAEIIISILAILKVGATYMPIEPEYPESRVEFMVENSKASAIITTETLKDMIVNDANIIIIEKISLNESEATNNIDIPYHSDSLAYIMYTSGTTGVPKAVMIKNYSVINFAECMRRRLDYSASSDNKVLSVTTMCFDIFVFEVFPTLLFGLNLVIANEDEQKNPIMLSKLIEEEKICKILTTPSRIQLLFLDSKYLKCLNTLNEIILGGEPFPINFLTELPQYTQARIFNLYGPTETTVYSTFKELTNEKEITIGKPIENTTIYILDKNKKILPIGVRGDLYIGGVGVAQGYYRNEELTNEKFVKNPYNENEIIYQTGDLAKWLPNGELICLGRTDNQIKIRGYRIELGDIESHIAKFPGITKVVVADKEKNDRKKFLCAYYISDNDISISELHKYLVSRLPNYMVPSSYVRLDAFPLTPNHKINRKALPMPKTTFIQEEEYIAPSTDIEKLLCKTIEKVLKIDRLGIDDDIFSYSADSLSIIQIQTLLIPYGLKFKTQDFYQLRTVKAFATFVENQREENKNAVEDDSYLYQLNNLIIKHDNTFSSTLGKKSKEKGYFITGVTGFLGIHILHELLVSTNEDIYCAIREKTNTDVYTRIKNNWKYYYNDEELNEKRVHIIKCDLTSKGFALSNTQLDELAQNISYVINCAANVKYYGDYSKHEIINVTAVENLIDFCIKYGIHLSQISTTGISGNYLVSHHMDNILFSENDFYIGQNYKENVYIHSKFDAEKIIYESREKGLSYNIFRIGNLTARYCDGLFQQNKDENSFYNILKFIIENKIIPNEMLSQELEFTPVDLCAKAIVLLSELDNFKNKTFHVYDEKFVSMNHFLEMLDSIDIHVEKLSTKDFNKKILLLAKDEKTTDNLKAIINDLDNKRGLSFMPSVILSNDITNELLAKLGFLWPDITIDYLMKTIKIILS